MIKNVTGKYRPVTVVWEVTMGCNMNCAHCGSSCNKPYPDELTTQEALTTIEDIAALGVKWITLSGGEPLTRKDLPLLIRKIKAMGMSANVITNGWLLPDMAQELRDAGVSVVAISIDGTREIHNETRKQGSFERDLVGITHLRKLGVEVGVITTITKKNLYVLRELKEDLIKARVNSWQVQIGLPMGNLLKHKENIIEPQEVDKIIDFCYETALEGKIKMYPADCIGYYTVKEQEVKKRAYNAEGILWEGCNAGIRGFGLLQNGDVIGCTSVRSPEFIEGNVREKSLNEIWTGTNSFAWRRNMTKEMLSGECRTCKYGSRCLGGCANTRLTMEGSIYGENKYCSYNVYLKQRMAEIARETNAKALLMKAQQAVQSNEPQEAAILAQRALELDRVNTELYRLKGYADYMCGNYKEAQKSNEEALKLNENDAYALKGLALSVYKQNKLPYEEVMALMERANQLSNGADMDIIHDMNVLKQEHLASR